MDDEEKKSKGFGRYLFLGLLILAVGLVCGLRLSNWQILNHAKWLQTADQSSTDTVPMDAARGEILDSKGNGLAINQTGYAIQFNAATMTSTTKNKTILTLIKLLNSKKEKWEDDLPIRVNSAGKYEFIPGEDKEISYLKSKDCLNVNSYATADECMQQFVDKYECTGFSVKDTRDIVSVRYNMTKSGFSVSLPYTFASGVSQNTIAIMSENSADMPGVETKVTTIRQYPNGTLMPQILGTVGPITQEEYDELHATKGYALNDRLGQSGIEQAFEDQLRGKAGEKTVKLKTDGSFGSETVTKQPVSGNSVYLTIDSNLQKVVSASLAKNVKATQANGRLTGKGADCVGGAAVVLRVSDFAVLAAATYPSYDQNQYTNDSNYYNQLLKDSAKPLINRAFNGSFTPGSIFKPSVALAALQEGSITDSTVITCNGVFTLNDLRVRCWQRSGHGPLTLSGALAQSCNVFFCTTAYRTGITAMNLYAKRLGLGQKTGLEIPESTGILAGPAERKAAGGIWTDGDTAQAGIGQSDNMITPVQLATYCATIANNGVRLQTHLVDKITDYSRSKIIKTTPVTEIDNIGVSQQNINYVKAGMREVIASPSGTAHSVFANYGIAIGAKTGTAQTGNGSDNVTFIGFAPFDHPQIAIAVALEHGATSLYSNSVAKDIFDAYFFGKTVDASGNLVMPSASSSASSGSSSSASSRSAG